MMKKLKITIFTLLMIICIGTASVFAQQKVTHTVKDDDTLFSISKKYGVSITEIKEWNQIEGNTISLGQQLTLFISEPENDATKSDSVNTGTSLLQIDPVQNNTFYTVKSGDNLYNIAQAHGMSITQLKELNGLTGDIIRVGQKLSVKALSIAPSVSEFSEESTPQGKFVVYTVQPGENIADILTRFNMTKDEFNALNTDINPDRLSSGIKITVLLPTSKNFKNPYSTKANLQDLGQVAISTYSNNEIGKATTSGELYNPNELTAAHSNISLGSVIYIENPDANTGIYVRINDRTSEEGLKLSTRAFEALNFRSGVPEKVNIYLENR